MDGSVNSISDNLLMFKGLICSWSASDGLIGHVTIVSITAGLHRHLTFLVRQFHLHIHFNSCAK